MTLNNRRSVVASVLPIFTPNTLLERASFKLNENVLILKMKQGTVKRQVFKIGQWFGLAAPVREGNVNVGGRCTSVIPSFHVWYSKLKYPSREDASNNVLILKIWSNMTPVGFFFFLFYNAFGLVRFSSYKDQCWAEKVIIWIVLLNLPGATRSTHFCNNRASFICCHSFCNTWVNTAQKLIMMKKLRWLGTVLGRTKCANVLSKPIVYGTSS